MTTIFQQIGAYFLFTTNFSQSLSITFSPEPFSIYSSLSAVAAVDTFQVVEL